MLDLRTPTGWFFLLLGIILLALGVFEPGLRASLTNANVNLYCSIAMLVFGAVMLLLARRRS
jgi:hypothetical protein